ncbi:MAG: lipolytic protein G-D-S-L family [Alistipes sp.]|jgi:lysophospholipase L1-like esterase|nr:lipolytic protein G-D-S-L family [Alistipes sp.]MBQ1980751.1 lipolytic protein G-D-S-L family [Alistipes sp.]MBQ2415100.1 lipolytic protein G-D-S-L family [Alistipes sp.]MBQ5785842.1 lipolytic protein G-D-S-L family [Alistipes sp.]
MKRLLSLLLIALFALSYQTQAANKIKTCNVIYIGNSITAGAGHKESLKSAPPVISAQILEKKLGKDVNFRNCGRSGATTLDFVPSHNRDFKRVEKAIKEIQDISQEPIIFSIMLGTNDSASTRCYGAPASNAQYKKNLMDLISRLRKMAPGAIFVLQRPIWYSPNTYNGAMYLTAGLKRVTDYANVLLEIAQQEKDVFVGDYEAFDFFKQHYRKYMFAENGNAGVFFLHPNEDGAKELAKFWSKGIISALKKNRK